MDRLSLGIWDVLGVAPTGDEREIKRAYARQLKRCRPDDDVETFQQLRQAYEQALRMAAFARSEAAGDGDEPSLDWSRAESAPLEATLTAETHVHPGDQLDAEAAMRVNAEPDPPSSYIAMAEAMRIAQGLWLGFVSNAVVSPRQKLVRVAADGELLNFLTKEAFEVCAARYCAIDACAPNIREAAVEHFGWHADAGHLYRLDSAAAHDTLARYRADRAYDKLLPETSKDPALASLMASTLSPNSLRLAWGPTTRAIRRHAAIIRQYHPELLRYRLNHEVFTWWERKAAAKKYFMDTVLYSMGAGLVLYWIAYGILSTLAIKEPAWLAIVCQGAAFAALATLAFRPPRRLYARLAGFKNQSLGRLLHDHRHRPAWQYGWLPLFFIFSLLLFCHDPGPAAYYVVAFGVIACCAWAVFAASAFFAMAFYLVVGVMALILAVMFPRSAYGHLSSFAFWFTILTFGVQGGLVMYAQLGVPAKLLLKARLLWLAGFVGIYALSGSLGDGMLAAVVWSWALAGMLLTRMTFNTAVMWLAILGIRMVLTIGNGRFDKDIGGPLPMLLTLMTLVLYFMLQNMYHAKTKDLPFS